jgi:hypothetical protein
LPIAATIALEMIGPMPGTVISRSHAGSWQASAPISLDRPSLWCGPASLRRQT